MNADDFLQNLKQVFEKTAQDMVPTMEEAALTGKALLARRVQNTGIGKNYTSRSYVRLRAKRGFEIRFVNLTFSGGMFQGWKQPGNYRDGLKIGGSVGGIDLATKNKLRWNKSRYPNFDKLTQEEADIIKDNLVVPRFKEIFKNNLLRP